MVCAGGPGQGRVAPVKAFFRYDLGVYFLVKEEEKHDAVLTVSPDEIRRWEVTTQRWREMQNEILRRARQAEELPKSERIYH